MRFGEGFKIFISSTILEGLFRSGKFFVWQKLFACLVGSPWMFVLMFVSCEGGDTKIQFDGLYILLGYCLPYFLCYLSLHKILIYILHLIVFQLRRERYVRGLVVELPILIHMENWAMILLTLCLMVDFCSMLTKQNLCDLFV